MTLILKYRRVMVEELFSQNTSAKIKMRCYNVYNGTIICEILLAALKV